MLARAPLAGYVLKDTGSICSVITLPNPTGVFGTIELYQSVRYGLNTLPNTPARFGTNSIPVPGTSVSSVRRQYRFYLPYILKEAVKATRL